MKMTAHATARMNQRGISPEAVDLILKYGSCRQVRDGGIGVFLGNKQSQEIISGLKRTIQLIDRAKNGFVVLKDDCLLTAYKI
jgi:hypothetical protein